MGVGREQPWEAAPGERIRFGRAGRRVGRRLVTGPFSLGEPRFSNGPSFAVRSGPAGRTSSGRVDQLGARARVRPLDASVRGRTLVRVLVAHLDLDAFYAAVEELENPTLREAPLVVGGDPQGRGVVATANYVARRYGIHSAMSAAEALRRCPHAVFVRPRMSVYREYSVAVWETVRGVVPTVERTGLDEGYLELDEVCPTFAHARVVAEAVQTAVRGATALSCSLGVGTSKVVAKVASDRRKPGGITVVRPGREGSFLGPFDIRLLPGIGPRTEERLRRLGIETLGALAELSDAELDRLLPGKLGRLLRDRARGIDPRALEPPTESISMSYEETFPRDVADRERLHDELTRMAGRLADSLLSSGRAARTVTTKVRYPDFAIRSRSTTLAVGTDEATRISELACGLLDRALTDRPGALRLVGVGVSGFEPFRQLSLPLTKS
jgi:DNA polymerase-4